MSDNTTQEPMSISQPPLGTNVKIEWKRTPPSSGSVMEMNQLMRQMYEPLRQYLETYFYQYFKGYEERLARIEEKLNLQHSIPAASADDSEIESYLRGGHRTAGAGL